jgi:3-oxoacyl-[acyl-carrier-protein] synthase II
LIRPNGTTEEICKVNKVYITASGTVSAAGLNHESFVDSVFSGKCGIRKISGFSTERLRTEIAAQVNLPEVLKLIGFNEVRHPLFRESMNLSCNPKLAMAILALIRIFESLGPAPACSGSESVPPLKNIPDWAENCALFSTAGLEEVSIEGLWQRNNQSETAPDTRKISHLCQEIPPAFMSIVLSDLFSLGQAPVSTVSACAASTQSIGEAFRALQDGHISMAIAGGTDSMIFPFGINAFNSLAALTEGDDPSNSLRPFARRRRGTVLGEGAAYFLLESSEGIAVTGHRPLATIVGYGSSMDAFHHVKPHPSGDGAIRAMNTAMEDARVNPSQIGYINAHGSGTLQNDRVEAAAIRSIFGDQDSQPHVSSTKPCHGHMLTAGGAMELAIALEALICHKAPPASGMTSDDIEEPVNVPMTANCTFDNDYVISNSFGLNGQNGVLILKTCS